MPAIVIGIVWAQMYDPSNGLVNGMLTGIGLEQLESFAWLGEGCTAMRVSMFVIVWCIVGFYMVLFIAAIKGIPAELYDAARVDGAGRIRMAMSITMPMVRDTIQTAYIYLGILALDAFVYMAALNSSGGPQNSTLTISPGPFNTAFKKGKFGYASAMGVVAGRASPWRLRGIVFLVNCSPAGSTVTALTVGHRRHAPPSGPATPPTPAARRARRRRTTARSDRRAPHIVLSIWSIIVGAPLLWVFLSSFKTTKEIFASPFALPQHWNFDNYIGAWTTSHIGRYMFNSVIVVSVSSSLS